MFVGDIPKGHSVDGPPVSAKDGKEGLVLAGLQLLEGGRIGIGFVRPAGPSVFFPWVDGNIKFCDLDFQAQAGEAVNGSVEVGRGRFIDRPVALDADAGDGNAGSHELSEEAIYPF